MSVPPTRSHAVCEPLSRRTGWWFIFCDYAENYIPQYNRKYIHEDRDMTQVTIVGDCFFIDAELGPSRPRPPAPSARASRR